MNTKSDSANNSSDRRGLIGAITTPLAFTTLALLVTETLVGLVLGSNRTIDGNLVVWLVIGPIILYVLIIFLVAAFRPEALFGKRPTPAVPTELAVLADEDASPTKRLAVLQDLIARETRSSLLANFNVPESYTAEISTIDGLPFGFCYPKSWLFTRLPSSLQYGLAIDPQSAQSIGFRRNLNIIVDDISKVDADLDSIYEANLSNSLKLLANAKVVFVDRGFILNGLRALRYRIDWTIKNEQGAPQPLSAYQILVANKERKSLYTLTFSTSSEDFEQTRPLFDNISNTFRFG